jgi:hypothetical protein
LGSYCARSTVAPGIAAEQPVAVCVIHRVVLWGLCFAAGPVLCSADGWKMPHIENDHVVETTNEARAAVTGHNVRYVLVISTLAVIVLFAVAYIATRW